MFNFVRRITDNFEMSIKSSFRLYSQRINVLFTLVVLPYIVASNGGFVAQAVNLLPETFRVIIAPFVGMVAFGLVTWARLHIQPKLRNDGQ